MACVIETDITINADASRVWAVVSNLADYANWNPFLVHAAGRPEAGERLSVCAARADGRRVDFRPVVLMAAAPMHLRWLARRWPLPGLLDIEQGFVIEPREVSSAVHVVQRVRLEGFFALVLRRRLEAELFERCAAMNAALKRRVEAERD